MKRESKCRAKMPRLKTDRQAEHFVSDGDRARHDLTDFRTTQFEFAAKGTRIDMRLPDELPSAVRRAAQRRGVPHQRFIRQTLERAIKE